MAMDLWFIFRRCLLNFFPTTFALVFGAPIFSMEKAETLFRQYDNAPEYIKEFYQTQHANQTVDFVRQQRKYLDDLSFKIKMHDDKTVVRLLDQKKLVHMTIWQALMMLDQLQDQSDPDFTLPNSIHALQTAEAIRRDLPNIAREFNIEQENLTWLILVGLLHDIGKVDALLRKVPQWAVVGDSFPVGCRFSKKNIFHQFFATNLDINNILYTTKFGIYSDNVGLKNLLISFGHDEYAYQVLKNQGHLPSRASFIIRFHSFYPFHQLDAYRHFLSESDQQNLPWSKLFSRYDLYSKSDVAINVDELRPFYRNLINQYFPPTEDEIKAAPSKELAEHKLLWPVLPDVK